MSEVTDEDENAESDEEPRPPAPPPQQKAEDVLMKELENIVDRVETDLEKAHYSQRNHDGAFTRTTGAAMARREQRRFGEAQRGHVRGLNKGMAEQPSQKLTWSQRKGRRRRANKRKRDRTASCESDRQAESQETSG